MRTATQRSSSSIESVTEAHDSCDCEQEVRLLPDAVDVRQLQTVSLYPANSYFGIPCTPFSTLYLNK